MVRMTGTVAAKRLGDVAADKQFWCRDGRFLNNLNDLENALKGMNEETFRYHVTANNNDFSNWVRDVFGDVKLAGDISKSRLPFQAGERVAERIAWLKSKIPGQVR